jgi:hypothetical protein
MCETTAHVRGESWRLIVTVGTVHGPAPFAKRSRERLWKVVSEWGNEVDENE